MQVNRVYSNNYSNQPNFGMAVTASAKGKQMLAKCLTPKGAMKLEKIIEAEKANPTNVHLTTRPSFISGRGFEPLPCEEFLVVVEDKQFRSKFFEDIFGISNGIISIIKRAVKYAHSLTDNRNVLKNISEK